LIGRIGQVMILLTLLFVIAIAPHSMAAPPSPQDMAGQLLTSKLPPEALTWSRATVAVRKRGHPKLDSALTDVVTAARVSTAQGLDMATDRAIAVLQDRVQVHIVIRPGGLERVSELVAQVGGAITGTASDDTLLQAWLPIDALERVAHDERVDAVRQPPLLVELNTPTVGTYTTQGATVSNALAWHAAGHTGAGVKIGIIDGGFSGYPARLGSDLPASVTVRNFVDFESDALVNGTTAHGTACAEIIHDMAPGAQLYLAKVNTQVDLSQAVDWLVNTHRVDIISTSIGWIAATPGDGTGFFAQLVDYARSAGTLWITAAGNSRQNHWGGPWTDSGDGTLAFGPGQDVNFFGPGDGYAYLIPSGHTLGVHLRWSNWTHVNQDYDLYLLRWSGSSWQTVAASFNDQNGGPGQTPTERIYYVTSGSATHYGVVVVRHSANPAQPVHFDLFTSGSPRLDKIVTQQSLCDLADAPGAITVGAVHVQSPYLQESYSSEGPTKGPGGVAAGGLPKVDISAYANVSTASYGSGGFDGTSAATPHVAGAAALIRGAYPTFGPNAIQSMLTYRAIDMGPAGWDRAYGAGRLHMSSLPLPLLFRLALPQVMRAVPSQ
jgi:subtilisin family serine protease